MPDVTPPAPPAPAAAAAVTAAPPAAPAAPLIGGEAPPPPLEFKVPDGFAADDELLAKFKPLAIEAKLDSAGAQKLVDLYAGTIKANAEKAEAAWAQQQGRWADEVKADQELGGAAFEATKVEVRRFFNAYDKDGSIRKAIADLGLGNHPALVKLAARAAKAIREDSVATSTASAPAEQSEQDSLRARYPSMFKE